MEQLYAHSLIQETIPEDALRVLRSSLKATGKAQLETDILGGNLTADMIAFAKDFMSPSGVHLQSSPSDFMNRCHEFDRTLRGFLQEIGSRVDLADFSPQRLRDPKIHCNLAGACQKAGILAEHGYCDAVAIEAGRARVRKDHIIRFRKGEMLMDVTGDGDSFHIIRFLAVSPTISTVVKLRTISEMLRLLHRTTSVVTAKAATVDDNSVKMGSDGEWRFREENSPWGFKVSRLEEFWLRVGAVTDRFLGDEKHGLLFFRENEAVEFLKRFRQKLPAGPSPYALASRWGIFGKETLARLKEG